MDYKQAAAEAMELTKLLEADGARLPGSDEERAACKKIVAETEARTGLKAKTERFFVAPNAGIGCIDKLGWAVVAATLLFYLSPFPALVIYVGVMAVAFLQIFRYTAKLDGFFKKEVADNIITEIPPASGKTDYTIYLGAHYDSSWCWKLAVKNPDTAILKLILGIVSVLAMIALCIMRIVTIYVPLGSASAYTAMSYVYNFFPLVGILLMLNITQFVSMDKTIASPGAMDNLSGIFLNTMIMKHYAKNPEELPENCRLVNIGFACEEAGLKGSQAFVDAHKNDPDFKNCYVLNVDSVADPEHFEAIRGDAWQGTKFDPKLIALTLESMRDAGIENPKTIVNPVGGCDSTPFCLEGIPTVTIAAQNPKSTYYYHTYYDRTDRIDVTTFEKGVEVIDRLIHKIGESRKA